VACEECKTVLPDNKLLSSHQTAYHEDESDEKTEVHTYVSPYRFPRLDKKFICPIGCAFTTTCARSIRKHFVNDHGDSDLNQWGYLRDLLYKEYLLLLEKADTEPLSEDQKVLVG